MTTITAQPTRPTMAKIYGISTKPKGLLSWEWVESKITQANHYWVCSVRPNGRPHAVPISGIWFENALYFGGDRTTRRSRNLAANPHVSVHLESADDVVIIEGIASEVTDEAELKVVAQATETKFNSPLLLGSESVLYKVTPQVVLGWIGESFPTTASRWVIER